MSIEDLSIASQEVSSEIELEARILDRLNKQGVILELTVARNFQRILGPNRFDSNIYHSRHYRDIDPRTAEVKFREIDVVVHVTPIYNPHLSLSLWLILECKSKMTSPWVFFRSSERTNDYIECCYG